MRPNAVKPRMLYWKQWGNAAVKQEIFPSDILLRMEKVAPAFGTQTSAKVTVCNGSFRK